MQAPIEKNKDFNKPSKPNYETSVNQPLTNNHETNISRSSRLLEDGLYY